MQPSGTLIQDLENTLHFWFQGKDIDWVLIRPDRFVAAVGTADNATQELWQFCTSVLPASGRLAAQEALWRPRQSTVSL